MDETEDGTSILQGDVDLSDSNTVYGGLGYGVGEFVNPAEEGQNDYGWRYFSNGTAVSPTGEAYASDAATGTPFSLSKFLGSAYDKIKGAFTTGGVTDWAKVAALGYGAYQALSPPAEQKAGYQGGIPDLVANRQQIKYDDPNRQPGSGGRQYFTDTIYSEGKAPKLTPEQAKAAGAAQAAGILGAYKPAAAPPDQFVPFSQGVLPAGQQGPVAQDVVNTGTSTAPAKIENQNITRDQNIQTGFAKGGAPGRYLRGDTDGMADELEASIDGKQPAALSHGEFVIPADVVSHIGNGNSDAGVKKLYQMMSSVRKARTGTEEQGKRINPDKFLPGGNVKGYNGESGSVVKGYAGESGSVVDATVPALPSNRIGTESSLSNWAGPYVTNLMAKGQALAETPYEAYTGPLTAGPSQLQQQGMQGLAGLTVPSSIGAGATAAGQVGQKAAGMGYTPTAFTSGYSAPAGYQTGSFDTQFKAPGAYQTGSFDSGFTAPGAYDAASFANQFQGPADYQAGTFSSDFKAPTSYETGQFGTKEFDTAAAQKYMSPFVQTALNPQLAEMRRQSDISRLADAARMTRAGSYGGSRQALMESEGSRNLLTKQTEALGTGYATAFDKATGQFNQDQARQMQAQQALEASRQFGAGQNLSAAQMQAQFGQAAQQAAEASRQFGAGQAMTGAQQRAQYGLAGLQAGEASRQFGAGQAMTGAQSQAQFRQAQQQALEASRQFGAGQAMTGAQQQAQYGLAGQQGLEASRQFGYGQNMQQAQMAQQAAMQAQQGSEASRQFGAQYGLQALQQQLAAAQAQSGMGVQELGAGLNLAGAQLGAGAAQRGITSEGIAADKAQFEEQRDAPYKQLLFQQGLLQGMPLQAQSVLTEQPSTLNRLSSGIADASKFISSLYPADTATTTPTTTTTQ